MFDLLIEGIGSLRFGCTVGFLLPAVGPVLAGRRWAWVPALGFVLLAGTVGWARFAGWWPDAAGTVSLAVASLLALAALVVAVRSDRGEWYLATTVIVSVLAGWLWVPCVGEHFSEPLNNASQAPVTSLGQVLVYVTGISVPLLALAALPVAFPRLAEVRDHKWMVATGVMATVVVGISIVTGLYSELVVRFAPGAG